MDDRIEICRHCNRRIVRWGPAWLHLIERNVCCIGLSGHFTAEPIREEAR